ncbi:mucin-associated surface protein [Arthrobacter sp. ISL-69]|uniref:mucin-associated surface protein n=1 Tax=Arthrobacter sp. ISL-69 TaxID=2819113 RepID=UPI00288C4934|nr:mucin-associated surface protein [Arthrobacter sp. ISL-69]
MSSSSMPRHRQLSHKPWRTVLAAGLISAALAGCGTAAPDLQNDAAQQLQAKVLTVSEAAAGNDPDAALKSLDELVAQLDASAADGGVSFKRHQSIMKAIEAVRADLAAAQAQAEAAAAEAAAAEAAAAAAAQASHAAQPPAQVQAPAPAQGNSGPGKGEKGKGKDD